MSGVKRRYDSTGRRAEAERTRRRMLDSARRLFAAHGYVATTVEAIAADAGVSPPTFYTAYRSKRGVLFALLDEMAVAADPAALAEALTTARDAAAQLALLVDYRTRLYHGAFDILEAARAAAPASADVAEMWNEGEQRRRRNHQQLLAQWHKNRDLKPGCTRAQADDILWAMTGPDVYRLFVSDRGWSRSRYSAWLTSVLREELLGTGEH